MIVLQRSPKPLDKDVVDCSAFTIHADFDALAFQIAYPLLTGKLASLIGIDNLRLAVIFYGLLQDCQRCLCFKRIGYSPADYIPTVQIGNTL